MGRVSNKEVTAARAKLTEGSLSRHLLDLAIPMMIGIVAIAFFNMVDTFFVGRLGTQELAAMTFTFPVVFAFGSFTLGLGVGVMSLISRALGAKEHEQVRRVATDSLSLGLLFSVSFSVIGYFTIDPLFRFLGASEEILPLIREYMQIWYIGMSFLVIPMIGNSVIRATGDTRTPAMVMIFAGAINALLDPLFIFGLGPVPAMGLKGAAIATVIGRALTFVVAFWILLLRERVIDLHPVGLRKVFHSWREVLVMGLPISVSNVAVPLTTGFVTYLVATHGNEVVAAFGAATRIEALAVLPMMGLGAGMAPLVGQNWGAQRLDRVRGTVELARRFCFYWGIFAWALLAALAGPLTALFPANEIFDTAFTHYLRIAPMGYGLLGMAVVAVSAFNAVGKPLKASALTLLRAPVLVGTFSYAGSVLFGVEGVFAGQAAAFAGAGAVAMVAMRRSFSREPPSTVDSEGATDKLAKDAAVELPGEALI